MIAEGYESGFLKVISKSDLRQDRNILWKCICVCGAEILVKAAILKRLDKKSCGCKSKAEVTGTHGMYGSPTHNSWRNMKDRCLNISHKSYDFYKNIPIDIQWINSFEAFYNDMGERPEGTTLDRVDGTKGYNKENCRWATDSQQQQNKLPNYINKNKGLAGVFESNGKFCARIRYNGEREYLGIFATPEEANAAYNGEVLEFLVTLGFIKDKNDEG